MKTVKTWARTSFSLILALAVALTVMPVSTMQAYAAEGDPAMVEGSAVLKQNANEESMQKLYYGDGRAWYVIGYDGEGNNYAAQSGVITLLHESVDQSTQFNEDYTSEDSNKYGGSKLQAHIESWLNGGDRAIFSEKEQDVMVSRTLEGGSANWVEDGYDFNKIKGDDVNALIWPLSVAEAKEVPMNIRALGSNCWWLRSPGGINGEFYCAADVDEGGFVLGYGYSVRNAYAVRPAFDLNLSYVLFTSAAEGVKSSGTAGADALTKVETNSGNEWKVTLKDDARSDFKVDSVTGDRSAVTITYSGASVGTENTAEFISAIIEDSSGDITYYGNIVAVTDTSGEATINLSGKYNEGDTLYVFNEQLNGDKKTDYSSELKEVEIPVLVEYDVKVTVDPEAGGSASADPTSGEEGTEVTLTATPNNGFQFKGWEVVSGGVTIESDKFMIGTEDVEVKATFEELPPEEYSVTVLDDGNGTGSADPTSGVEGTEVMLTATPNNGFQFKGWEVVSGGVTIESNKFTIGTEDVEVKTTFEEIPATVYTVSFDAGGGSGSMSDITVSEGDKLTLPDNGFAAPEGKEFDAWDAGAPGEQIDVTVDMTVTALWKDKELEPEPEHHHEHSYAWEVTKQATPVEDGEMVYACTECGTVAQRLPISGYIAFNEDVANKIRKAHYGAEVLVRTDKWISFYSVVWDELAKRPDVSLVIDYISLSKTYEVIVPAGTNVESLKDQQGYAGFLYLSGQFGRREIKTQ